MGTSLTSLAAARNPAAWFQAATFLLWVPLLLGIAWLLLGRVLAPLREIAATARSPHSRRDRGPVDPEAAILRGPFQSTPSESRCL